MIKRKFLTGLLSTLLFSATMIAPTAASAAPAGGGLVTVVMQSISGVGTFSGTLTTTGVSVVNGALNATGTLNGTFTNTAGTVTNIVNQAVTFPIAGLTGNCTILTLHTGAINLDVLGLKVALAPIDLVITAQSGPGNLLGNLLCAVVHLLDGGGPLTGLAGLLNNILRAL